MTSQVTNMRNMLADSAPDLAAGPFKVANFYAGRNVLLTGGTGFLGTLLIERILRSCPKVNKLFLLVRTKKGKRPEERLKELFDDIIFDRLRKERPGFSRKVVLVDGDMTQIGLGLSSEQRELLRSTHIVIHGAATVRFDEQLRAAVSINIRGTEELLLLAKEMPDIKAFVHISTAYSNCVFNVIDEKFYPPSIDSEKLLTLVDIMDDASLDHLTPVLLGKWPNTYTFTKAVTEDNIRRKCQNLPVCIVRPSIVIATSKEPIAGWVNNVYGMTGVLSGAAVGLLHTLHCDENMVADVIPADYVVNNIIVAAWRTAEDNCLNLNSADSLTVPGIAEPRIYNVVSSNQRPITWGRLMKYTAECWSKIPSVVSIWYLCFTFNKYYWIHNLYVLFLHLIPAAVVDSLTWLTGREPKLWTTYKKIHKFTSVIEYFTLQQWQFHDNNVQRLWTELGPADRSEFDLDIGSLNWKDYNYDYVRGLRVYILKDPLATCEQGNIKYAKLRIVHYTLVTIVCGVLLWMLWTCLRFIGL